jgi:hypothetical protein
VAARQVAALCGRCADNVRIPLSMAALPVNLTVTRLDLMTRGV